MPDPDLRRRSGSDFTALEAARQRRVHGRPFSGPHHRRRRHRRALVQGPADRDAGRDAHCRRAAAGRCAGRRADQAVGDRCAARVAEYSFVVSASGMAPRRGLAVAAAMASALDRCRCRSRQHRDAAAQVDRNRRARPGRGEGGARSPAWVRTAIRARGRRDPRASRAVPLDGDADARVPLGAGSGRDRD